MPLINTAIIREPMNWLVVLTMVIIGTIGATLLCELFSGLKSQRP